jgi:hypothetical protein
MQHWKYVSHSLRKKRSKKHRLSYGRLRGVDIKVDSFAATALRKALGVVCVCVAAVPHMLMEAADCQASLAITVGLGGAALLLAASCAC